MIEFLIIAVIGSVIAGLWDLKTTEVPDEVPALMIVLGIFLWYMNAGMTGDFSNLLFSLLIGTILLTGGLIMYKSGQWGGADAWILAAIGYLIPFYNGRLFMIDFIPNFLIVSVIYMVLYSIVVGVINRYVFGYFLDMIREKWKIVFGIPVAYFVFLLFITSMLASNGFYFNTTPLTLSALLILLVMIFWAYAKSIEEYVFKKKIHVSRLKVGDVLEEMLWRGITKEELAAIKKKKRFVTIKEGVRFVPAFPITLIVTLLWGNLLFVFLGI